MIGFFTANSNFGDAITGERVLPGERVFDTGYANRNSPWIGRGKTRVIKEDTIVWLAEQAGYDVVKRVAGDSGNAKSVDAADVESGDGEVEAGEAEVGGSKPAKRRSGGSAKSK